MRINTITLLLACLLACSCRHTQGKGVSCQQELDTLASLSMADSLSEPMVSPEEIEVPSIFYGDVEGGRYVEVEVESFRGRFSAKPHLMNIVSRLKSLQTFIIPTIPL